MWPALLARHCCQVLLEVAASVQHLHNMQLLHCDIKPENVLLKSNNSNVLGFTTKLSDFGLAKLLRDNYYIINRSGSGTVTHLAPELFQVRWTFWSMLQVQAVGWCLCACSRSLMPCIKFLCAGLSMQLLQSQLYTSKPASVLAFSCC